MKNGLLLFVLLGALLVAAPARAAGVVETSPLKATYAARPIAIDGRFDDWPEVASSRLAPFKAVASYADPAMARVFAAHPGLLDNEAELLLAHDREALYLGLRLGDATPAVNTAAHPDLWYGGGDGLVVHGRVASGRHFSILWWGGDRDGTPRVAVRLAGGAWQDIAAFGGKAAMTVEPGKGCAVEIRVPWSALDVGAAAPPRLDLVWEVAFSGVDRALLKALPQEMRVHMKMHASFNVLTAPGKSASRSYLSRPEWWGALRFGDAEASPAGLTENAGGTGLTEWLAPQTARPPAIDGALDDWPSAWLRTPAAAPWAYGDRYRADLGICWDATHLYLAVRYRDGEPMFNTEVAENQMGFRGGDCLQIRLKIGDKVTNLCGWYDTQNGVAALTADGKERKQPNLLAAGAREAFAPLPEGRGVIQEIAIPFTELLAAAPAVGDTWNATFQLWWAGIDERFSVETSVNFVQPPPVETRYDLPRTANVSLGVFDLQGRLLRHLLKDEPRQAGVNLENWDGLDQWGKVIPAGAYVLKGVHHEPLTLKYLMSAINPGTPAWATVDGKGGWLSDQAAPQDVVTDGVNVYIAAPYAEAGHHILAVGPDGKRIWGVNPNVGTPRCISLALMGDRLYAMYSGPELTETVNHYKDGDKTARGRAMILCFDRRTGELAGPSVKSGAPIEFATWEYRHDVHNLWDLRLNRTFSPATYGGQHRYSNTSMCETTGGLGLAPAGNRLVASLFYDNELVVLDPDSLATIKRIALEAPAGLHGLDESQVLAISGKQVVKVDIDTGTSTPVVTTGLVAPFGVTTDRDGNIYVSDWGASFQVKRFGADGRLQKTIGKEGGRPWTGLWEEKAMAVPRGIAVTDDGMLWVAEDEFAPRRVSVWRADSGSFLRDYIGLANYRGWGLTLDPENPERILTCGTEFRLDFRNQTYAPVRKMFMRRSRDDIFMDDGNGMGSFSRLLRRDGEEFLVSGQRDRVVVMQRRGDEYRAVAAASGFEAGLTIDGTQRSFWDSDLRRHYLPDWNPAFFKGQAGKNHIWNDLNGDGIVQEDEIEWQPDTLRRGDPFAPGRMGEWGVGWGLGFGPDWEIYMHGFCRDAATIYRLDPEFVDGLPRYSFDRSRPIIHHQGDGRPQVESVYASTSGKLYVTYINDVNRGIFADKGLVCYDREGRELWSIAGARDTAAKSVHGYPNAEFSYPELGSGVVTWVWWHNGRAYLLSDDGLYLAGFLDDTLVTGPSRTRGGGETSSFAVQGPDGRLFLVNGEDSSHHIHEIEGLDTARRFEQELVITPVDVAAAERAQPTGRTTETEKPVVLVAYAAHPPARGDWDVERDGVQLATTRRSGRGGRIALKTDGEYLYLAARIQDETPMVNNGDNWQTPFMSGDGVDLMLATDPQADPNRRTAVAGDLRLLFTELRGQPMAVLYRPVVPGAKNPVQMLAATIDEIRRLPDDCAPVIAREEGTYTLTARVPLAVLGLESLPRELRGDVGVIYGDASGRDRDQRLYYYNPATAMISDLTTEASLSPNGWGQVLFAMPGNRVENAGFEEGSKKSADGAIDGWEVCVARNGAVARLIDTPVFAGHRALQMEQELPVRLPDDPALLKDAGRYYKALNDGQGGGFMLLDQRVSVEGGGKYNLSFTYRAENLVREKRGGPPGYAAFQVLIFWGNEKGGLGAVSAFRTDRDQPTWRRLDNPRGGYVPLEGLPYTAPADATHAQIRLQLVVNADATPTIQVDQVEFAPAREQDESRGGF